MADVKIEVIGKDAEEALGLAIWDAFDAAREKLSAATGKGYHLSYDLLLGRQLACQVLEEMFNRATTNKEKP